MGWRLTLQMFQRVCLAFKLLDLTTTTTTTTTNHKNSNETFGIISFQRVCVYLAFKILYLTKNQQLKWQKTFKNNQIDGTQVKFCRSFNVCVWLSSF